MALETTELRTRTVNELLLEYPSSVEAFNRFGIDACCGGAATVEEAAARDGAPLDELLDALRAAIGEVDA